jgi:hypothetical protein
MGQAVEGEALMTDEVEPWLKRMRERIAEGHVPSFSCYPPTVTVTTTGAKPVKPRRQRRPSVGPLIAQAEKSGKHVTSVTTPDGVTLTFGEPEDNTNDLDNWIAKHARSSERH